MVLKIYLPCKNFHMPSQYLFKPCNSKAYVYCWENKYMPRLKSHLPSQACNHKSLCALGQDLYAPGMRTCLNVEPCITWAIVEPVLCCHKATVTGLPAVREKSGKIFIFQGQGKVREFCEKSGKIFEWRKVREFCDECPQYFFYGSRHPFVPHLTRGTTGGRNYQLRPLSKWRRFACAVSGGHFRGFQSA